jgi:hypothetical protein
MLIALSPHQVEDPAGRVLIHSRLGDIVGAGL